MTGVASLLLLFAAASGLRTRRDIPPDPSEVCECVPYYACVEGKIVAEELGNRHRTCEGAVDVCCLPEKYAYLLSSTAAPPETTPEPYRPEPVRPDPVRPDPVRPDPDRPVPVNPEPTYTPDYPPIQVPLRPHGTGCGLKRIPQGSYGQDSDFRITATEYQPPERTGFGEFPWMVAIFRKEEDGANKFVCGGSIIRPDVVLTGAHCLRSSELGQIKVRAGDWDAQSVKEPIPHEDRGISRVIPHPDFNHENLINNVALLILDHPFTMSDTVDTVCIPSGPKDYFDERNCIATGWGMDKFGDKGKFQQVLRKVELPIVRRDACQEKLRKSRLGKFFNLHESFICAGGIPDRDTCYGDGGGPLVCPKTDDKNRYVQVGIVSWGIGCGSEYPGVYASVQHFSSWISKHLS